MQETNQKDVIDKVVEETVEETIEEKLSKLTWKERQEYYKKLSKIGRWFHVSTDPRGGKGMGTYVRRKSKMVCVKQ